MSEGRYSFSLTTFSPSGKLVQIEHALTAVSQGITSVGLKGVLLLYITWGNSVFTHTRMCNYEATGGVVIATEKKIPTPLVEADSVLKISPICESIGLVYSGMGPDARVLLDKARKLVQEYKKVYMEEPSVATLVKEIAGIMQEYTQSGCVTSLYVSCTKS